MCFVSHLLFFYLNHIQFSLKKDKKKAKQFVHIYVSVCILYINIYSITIQYTKALCHSCMLDKTNVYEQRFYSKVSHFVRHVKRASVSFEHSLFTKTQLLCIGTTLVYIYLLCSFTKQRSLPCFSLVPSSVCASFFSLFFSSLSFSSFFFFVYFFSKRSFSLLLSMRLFSGRLFTVYLSFSVMLRLCIHAARLLLLLLPP